MERSRSFNSSPSCIALKEREEGREEGRNEETKPTLASSFRTTTFRMRQLQVDLEVSRSFSLHLPHMTEENHLRPDTGQNTKVYGPVERLDSGTAGKICCKVVLVFSIRSSRRHAFTIYRNREKRERFCLLTIPLLHYVLPT